MAGVLFIGWIFFKIFRWSLLAAFFSRCIYPSNLLIYQEVQDDLHGIEIAFISGWKAMVSACLKKCTFPRIFYFMKYFVTFFLLLCLFLPQFAAAQLSRQEIKIAKAIDSRSAAALELLKISVNINSGTMNFEGVKEVGALYMEELSKLGLPNNWAKATIWLMLMCKTDSNHVLKCFTT